MTIGPRDYRVQASLTDYSVPLSQTLASQHFPQFHTSLLGGTPNNWFEAANVPSGGGIPGPQTSYVPLSGEVGIKLGGKTYYVNLTGTPEDFYVKNSTGHITPVASDIAAKLFGAERAWLLLQRLYDVDHVETQPDYWRQIEDSGQELVKLEALNKLVGKASGLFLGDLMNPGAVAPNALNAYLQFASSFTDTDLLAGVCTLAAGDIGIHDASSVLDRAHSGYSNLHQKFSDGDVLDFSALTSAVNGTLAGLYAGHAFSQVVADMPEFHKHVWEDVLDWAQSFIDGMFGAIKTIFDDIAEANETIDYSQAVAADIGRLNNVVDMVDLNAKVSEIIGRLHSDSVLYKGLTYSGLLQAQQQLEGLPCVDPAKPPSDFTPNTADGSVTIVPTHEGTLSVDVAGIADIATVNFAASTSPVNAYFSDATTFRAQTTDGLHLLYVYNVTSVIFLGGIDDDNATGGSGNDIILGALGDDNISSNDGGFGTGGTDFLFGGDGNDNIRDYGIGSAVDGGAGADHLQLDRSGLSDSLTLNMIAAAEGLTQHLTDETTIVNVETLDLTSGTGDDNVTFDIEDGSQQVWQGSGGSDTAVMDVSNASLGDVSIRSGYVNSTDYRVRYFDGGDNAFIYLYNVENVSVTGQKFGDSLSGGDGNDELSGMDGNDSLSAGRGDNVISGGNGNDSIEDSGQGSTIDGGSGIDTLNLDRSSLSTALILDMIACAHGTLQNLPDGTTIKNIEKLDLTSGTGNDQVTFDVLDASQQVWQGAGGNDTAIMDVSAASLGDASIRSGYINTTDYRVRYFDGGDNAFIYLYNVENVSVTGQKFGDSLSGGDGNDKLSGLGGSDFLSGGRGNNILYGGSGNDSIDDSGQGSTIDGGSGIDTLNLDRSSLATAMTLNMIASAQGTLQTLPDGTTITNIEKLNLTSGTGNDQVTFDILDNAQQVWQGAGGNDTAIMDVSTASLGDAAIRSGYINTTDYRVRYFDGGDNAFIFLYNVENVSVTGQKFGDNLNGGDGNDAFAGIDGNDQIYGGAGKDVLSGENGKDYLSGGIGADSLSGGAGSDVFGYGPASDSTPAGFDTVTDLDALLDKFDVSNTITGIDPSRSASSINNITQAFNSAHLAINHAGIANLTNGQVFLVIDSNGQAGYQAYQDLLIRLDNPSNLASLSTANFI